MRKITFTDMMIEILVIACMMILLAEVHMNLVYAALLMVGYKVYILVDSYLYMRQRAREITEMIKSFGMQDLGNGMFLSKPEEDKNAKQDVSDNSSK